MVRDGPLTGPSTPSATLKFSIGDCLCSVPITGARYERERESQRKEISLSNRSLISARRMLPSAALRQAIILRFLLPDLESRCPIWLHDCTILHMSTRYRMSTESLAPPVRWVIGLLRWIPVTDSYPHPLRSCSDSCCATRCT